MFQGDNSKKGQIVFEDELNKKNDNGESLLQKGAPIDLGKEAAMEAEVRKFLQV